MNSAGYTSDHDVRKAVVAIVKSVGIGVGQKASLVEGIIAKKSWDVVAPILEQLMIEERNVQFADVFASVYFSASLERLDFPCDRIVAMLLLSGVTSGSDSYNQILSICVEAKGVKYQRYSPEDDPDVKKELQLIQTGS
jgi:hypothetical protein